MIYRVIGIARDDWLPGQMVRFHVAYEHLPSQQETYFTCQIPDEYVNHASVRQSLLQYSYEVGGPELAAAVEYHMNYHSFGNNIKIQTVKYAKPLPMNWGNPEATISMPVGTKTKVTVEGVVEQKYAQGGMIQGNGVVIHNNNFITQPKSGNGTPAGLEQLPGLDVKVNHPAYVAADCPLWDQTSLKKMIIHMNDNHKWTRERIADWLDEISDPTGETGPDLRFSTEPAKIEPTITSKLEGWANVGYTDHNPVQFKQESYEDCMESVNALQSMHLTVDFDKNNEQLMKLLMGETNEQD